MDYVNKDIIDISKKDIEHYYLVAPMIVAAIDQLDDSNKVYNLFFGEYAFFDLSSYNLKVFLICNYLYFYKYQMTMLSFYHYL